MTCWSRRFAMISQYFSSSSTPMALRPRLRAAISVAPLPANGSAITLGGHLRTSCSMSVSGLGVGWPMRFTSAPRASEVIYTFECTPDIPNSDIDEARTYISSSLETQGCVFSPASPVPGSAFTHRSLWHTLLGRGALHAPNTSPGRSPHASIALSRASVVLSPEIRSVPSACFLRLLARRSSLVLPVVLLCLWPMPYGGSVTSTSASNHSWCSVRQSP